jgi:hypothetical protein
MPVVFLRKYLVVIIALLLSSTAHGQVAGAAGSKHSGTSQLANVKGVISAYPDLPTGNLNVKWENQHSCVAKVVILDTADVEKYKSNLKITGPAGQSQIDISALANGQYTITITAPDIYFIGKLTVMP